MGAYGPLELLENLCVSQKDFVLLNFGPQIQRTGELEVQTEKKKKKEQFKNSRNSSLNNFSANKVLFPRVPIVV